MKRILAAFFAVTVALVAGCAPEQGRRIASHGTTRSVASPRALVGDQAVADLNRWYADTRADCGSASEPAFVCTGIMLRATQTSPAFLPWNPNPSSTGVSFSWMRADTNFRELVYGYWNGFIFYPKSEAPSGASAIDVLCAFPMDADTNSRPTLGGCGPSTQLPAKSVPCDDQGIVTSAAWLGYFNVAADKYRSQCGWNMHSGVSADRFVQSIQARRGMDAEWWPTQNELRLAKWAQNSVVPIRAFFYVPGRASALQNAQSDQQRYAQAFGGAFVPIVQMNLPLSKGGQASFHYQVADQAVDDPGDSEGGKELEDFENVPLQGPVNRIDLPSMRLDEHGRQEPMLFIDDASEPPIQGRHLTVRTIYDRGSAIYLSILSIYLNGSRDARGIRFLVKHNNKNSPQMGVQCVESFTPLHYVVLPMQGQVTLECPAGEKVVYFNFLEHGKDMTYQFDNIEILR